MKVDFWTELATKKLDTYRLNDDAQVSWPPSSTATSTKIKQQCCCRLVQTEASAHRVALFQSCSSRAITIKVSNS